MKASVVSNTPIYDFVMQYVDKDKLRLHMPGHKGSHPHPILSEISKYDITEIEGADVLFQSNGIISASEQIASDIYDTKATLYSTGGSTLSIQTMLSCTLSAKDSVIVSRNAHVAFINACILLDLDPIWVLPTYHDVSGVSGQVTAQDISNTITSNPHAKAVYITSPDYLGNICDIKSISAVCKEHAIPLLVDNAHGSHLIILDKYSHPIHQGADICVDSAHKSLPVLTGGGYLHISHDSHASKSVAKQHMALFGSTSPSYLTLLSLDLCNDYLLSNAKSDFAKMKKQIDTLKEIILSKGGKIIGTQNDFARLTIDCYSLGYTAKEILSILDAYNIEVEYHSDVHIVLMFSPYNGDCAFNAVQKIFTDLPIKRKLKSPEFTFTLPIKILSPRDAYFSTKEVMPIDESLGRIVAENKILCPPGVPIVVSGEKINNNSLNLLKNYSIFSITVVK